MLSAADLASMRSTATEALPGTAVIHSGTFVSDSGGGGSVAFLPAGTVDCRIAPVGGTEREFGNRISADADYIVTLPHNASVTENARLVIDGDTYNVEAIRDRSWNLTTRVEVVKHTP